MYFTLFFSSFLLTYFIRKIASKHLWVDTPKEKSSHKSPVPTGGGLAIALSWFSGLTYLYLNNSIESKLYWALLVGLLIVVLGFFDDLYNLKQRLRLLIQMSAVSLALYILGGLQSLDLGVIVIHNQIFLNILAFVGITWVINLYNFQDGIDGYAGSEAVFLSFAGFFLFKEPLLLLLAFPVLGFLCWNWQKAEIFMGDTGSLFLGFTLSLFAIHYQNNGFSILSFVILFSAFWCDSTATLIRDLWNKEDIMKRHKRFVFHKLVRAGWSHQKVVLYAMGFNLVLFALAFFSNSFRVLFWGFIFSLFLCYTVILLVDKILREEEKRKVENKSFLKNKMSPNQRISHHEKHHKAKPDPFKENLAFLEKIKRNQGAKNSQPKL